MAGYDPDKLKAFWEYCEAFKGWAKLLIVGNAAGLGYCLTALNGPTPKYNVGLFIVLFGCGLLLGGLYFLILTILKAEVTTAIVTQQGPGHSFRDGLLEILGHIGMWGSAAALIAGILLFAYRFWVL
jgi:hypothetical protein